MHCSIMLTARVLLLLTCAWWSLDHSQGAPAVQSTLQAMSYLTQFGYIESSTSSGRHSSLLTEDALTTAIREFQRFAGLNQTGTLDNETMVMMNTPRCGVKDKVGHGNNARRKRYALQGSRWRVKELTYKISKYPSTASLNKRQVDEEIQKSFLVWSEYTDLKFTQKTSGRVHIEVRFERGEHGDGDPFDGPGGTLAHAYFPIYGGDAHFDDTERWTIRSYRGTNLFQVAAHEFGHSLGLSHSDVRQALMAPFYRNYEPNFELHKDDISAIQALYGQKKARDHLPSKPTVGSASPPKGGEEHEEGELCSDPTIDTIFQLDGETFAFKGEYYWKLTDIGLADGYPRSISKDWVGLPSNIDAAFSWRNGKTYFFKGDKYYRFEGHKMDADYPQQIKDGFPGIPSSLDAAFVWSGNGKIYFFKGSLYWRFDPEQLPPVSEDYPKDISNWEGIPNNINAAFQWTNGYTYFFKGTNYWRFNDRTFSVDTSRPPFPRSSGIWWFGCKSMTADDDPQAGSLVSSTRQDRAYFVSTAEHSAAHSYESDVELYQPESEDIEVSESGVRAMRYGLGTLASTFLTMLASHILFRE